MQNTPFFTAHIEGTGEVFDAWPDRSLLQSADEGRVNWPSSCRNGTCRTCLGVLVSGEVTYSVEWPGLSPEEKAEGCVLPCVAHPTSAVVLRAPGP